MGQLMSSSRVSNNNDDLINSLIKSRVIRSKDVEKAFRCVDRGFYFNAVDKPKAYEDRAFQTGPIHLSSPSIYASVFEYLRLQPGHKFLNVGSGVGYLNTVAGLLLGANGVNHGVEINELVIDLALLKMDEFKLQAAAIDHFNFCEPIFVHGNACELSSSGYYDRVYCGAGVPPEEYQFFRSLIKIGGVLVMPLEGYLIRITRKDEFTWKSERKLEVAFLDLVVPPKNSFNIVKFPSVEPLSLLELCRLSIRSLLRRNLKIRFPELSIRTKCHLKIEEYKGVVDGNRRSQSCPLFRNILNHDALVYNYVDSFSGMERALSDGADGVSDYEIDEDLLDEENANESETEENRLEQNVPHNTLTETSDESTKRKSPEPENSGQNKTTSEVENTKKMKMNSSSRNSEDVPSTSSPNDSDSWETMSSNSSRLSLHNTDSESLVSSMDDDEERDILDESEDEESDARSVDSEDARDSETYKFINDCTQNDLSVLLKTKIDSLQIPVPLKKFLNYHRYNEDNKDT